MALPRNGKSRPGDPEAVRQFVSQPYTSPARGREREQDCMEHGSKPLCITQGVINLIISKAPLVFHEGHAPSCGLEYDCSRFQ